LYYIQSNFNLVYFEEPFKDYFFVFFENKEPFNSKVSMPIRNGFDDFLLKSNLIFEVKLLFRSFSALHLSFFKTLFLLKLNVERNKKLFGRPI
jgi:hypothetical protein